MTDRGPAVPAQPFEPSPGFNPRTNLWLFVATVISVFLAGRLWAPPPASGGWIARWLSGWTFAVPLLAILVAHEGGHYVASRFHRVPASLPYFIPLPLLSPFGTLGAVILMRGRIRSARALLDIGASGPIAGMLVAVPLMVVGLSLSPVMPAAPSGFIQEGQSLLYLALKRLVLGDIPPGYDVMLHPTALAAWTGFFITFLNLLPFSQLDGGHVAYALLGRRHDAWSHRMWLVPVALLGYNLWTHGRFAVLALLQGRAAMITGDQWDRLLSSTLLWVVLLLVMLLMRRRTGGLHPPVDETYLDPIRRRVGLGTLLMFVLLFMPSPWVAT